MDAKIVIIGHDRPKSSFAILGQIAAMVADSPYMSMPMPKVKPVKPYTVLRCKSCQGTSTLQKVDGEYYCRKCVRVRRGKVND